MIEQKVSLHLNRMGGSEDNCTGFNLPTGDADLN